MCLNVILYSLLLLILTIIPYSCCANIQVDVFTLEDKLVQLQPFIFFPNQGNIGDAIIHTSEFSLFNRLKLNYTVYKGEILDKDFNFVYSGGGVFIEGVYRCEERIKHILESKFLKQGIILSHSIRGCHNLLKLCEEKIIIFCREAKSYELAAKQSPLGNIFLDHDMALYTGREWYDKEPPYTENDGLLDGEQANVYNTYTTAYNILENVIKTKTYSFGNQTLRFFLRNDKEKAIKDFDKLNIDSFDLSAVIGIEFSKIAQLKLFADLFLSVLESTDIAVTDRLHVGIGAIKVGKLALVFDNTYGKISGVIDQSLKNCKNIKLINNFDNIITRDLVKLSSVVMPKPFIKRNLSDKKIFKSIYQYYTNTYNI